MPYHHYHEKIRYSTYFLPKIQKSPSVPIADAEIPAVEYLMKNRRDARYARARTTLLYYDITRVPHYNYKKLRDLFRLYAPAHPQQADRERAS